MSSSDLPLDDGFNNADQLPPRRSTRHWRFRLPSLELQLHPFTLRVSLGQIGHNSETSPVYSDEIDESSGFEQAEAPNTQLGSDFHDLSSSSSSDGLITADPPGFGFTRWLSPDDPEDRHGKA